MLSFANALANPCTDATWTAGRNAYTRFVLETRMLVIAFAPQLLLDGLLTLLGFLRLSC